MITPCCIFSYRDDSFEAVLAARSAQNAGLFPVFVVEDGSKPLCEKVKNDLSEMEVIVITSDFPRPGNLRGINCIYGMLQIFRRILRKTGATHLVKMDSDTILVSGDTIKLAAQKDPVLFGWSSPKYEFHGSTYLISDSLVEGMIRFISRWQGIPGLQNPSVAEDLAMFRMAVLFKGGDVLVSKYDPDGGFGAFWCWQDPEKYHEIFSSRFQSVSFGNRKDERGTSISRVESYKAMEAFFQHVKSCRIPSSFGSLLAV